MRLFSSVLRLLTGLIIMAMSWRVLASHGEQIRSNSPVLIDLYGHQFRVDGHTLLVIVLGMTAIGLALVVYGLMGFRPRRHGGGAAPST